MGRVARERPTSELGQIGERPSSGRGRAAAMMRSADHEVVVGRRPLPHVTKVEVLHDYVVRLEFDDGAVRIVDLGPELKGPVFEPLRDPDLFRQVTVDAANGTVIEFETHDVVVEHLDL